MHQQRQRTRRSGSAGIFSTSRRHASRRSFAAEDSTTFSGFARARIPSRILDAYRNSTRACVHNAIFDPFEYGPR